MNLILEIDSDESEFIEKYLRIGALKYLENKINEDIFKAKNDWDSWSKEIEKYKDSDEYARFLCIRNEIKVKTRAKVRVKKVDISELSTEIIC